jgi:hypothetical protein
LTNCGGTKFILLIFTEKAIGNDFPNYIKVTSAITIRNHRSRKSKKKRQYNGHKKRAKIRTNNDLQKHYEQKTEDYDVKRCLGHLLSQKEISKFQQHKLNKS